MNDAELQCGMEDCCCNLEKERKKTKKSSKITLLPLFLRREIAETFFASVLPTFCVPDRVTNVAPKQLQFWDIMMGRLTPIWRLAPRYPTNLILCSSEISWREKQTPAICNTLVSVFGKYRQKQNVCFLVCWGLRACGLPGSLLQYKKKNVKVVIFSVNISKKVL